MHQKEINVAAGLKYDEDKIRTDLLPVNPIMGIAKVLTFGAKKYADRNWEKGIAWNRVYGALQRHLMAWWGGQDCDPETGLSHLSHAGCCIMFLMEFEHTHRELDNRPQVGTEQDNKKQGATPLEPPKLSDWIRGASTTAPIAEGRPAGFRPNRHDQGYK